MNKFLSKTKKEFIEFLKGQGVMSLAIGFLLSGVVAKITTAFITDLVNPLIGLIFGNLGNLAQANFRIGGSFFLWGHFISVILDGVIVALVIYFAVKWLNLETKKQ